MEIDKGNQKGGFLCWLPLWAVKAESPVALVGMCFRILYPRSGRWDYLSTGCQHPLIKGCPMGVLILSCTSKFALEPVKTGTCTS